MTSENPNRRSPTFSFDIHTPPPTQTQFQEISGLPNQMEQLVHDIRNIENMGFDELMGLESSTELIEDSNLEGNAALDSMTPKIGMEFGTHEEAYIFYNKYALKIGFGIRRSSTTWSRADKSLVISRKYVCNKEGRKSLKSGEDVDPHRGTRVGCGAMMKISLTQTGAWKISLFVEQHDNHELTSPTKTSRHRSHKQVHRQPVVHRLVDQLHGEGISNTEIAKVVNVLHPDQHDRLTPQQVHDHLRVERKNNMGKNCAKIIEHFLDKHSTDKEFYSSIQVTEELTLRSVFWADGRSRESYRMFSDVIVFDVTYRTNTFSLPFAPFTGVNHHRQSTLFGCALLADETEDTFVWLFQQWLKCMDDKAPGAIITDQDAAIGNAIARVFPNTRHRFCDWHLDKNIGEHMIHLKAIHGPEFELYFNRLRGCTGIPEAEECWKELMTRYKLGENSWLPKLWERRERWVPCYLHDTFLAGMRTSQRAESINAFFDSFVNAKTALHEFVVQYDKALASRRAAEEDEDFATMNSQPVFILGWSVEEQAAKCYTKTLFTIFKQELTDAMSYWADKSQKVGTFTKYIVRRPNGGKSEGRIVTYDDCNGVEISCDCKMFETVGLLCRHALCILWKKHVTEIPDRYILKRWTICARYQRKVSISQSGSASTEMGREHYWSARRQCDKALEEAYKDSTFAEELERIIAKALVEHANRKKLAMVVEFDGPSSHEHGSQVGSSAAPIGLNITIHDSAGPVKTKGRPKLPSRILSGMEETQAESKKPQRTCGFCGEKGHYKTGCAKAKAAQFTSWTQYTPDGSQGFPSNN